MTPIKLALRQFQRSPLHPETLVERPSSRTQASSNLYERNCASCHGKDLRGTPPEFPALVDVNKKYSEAELQTVIRNGFGRMPRLLRPCLTRRPQALTKFLLTGQDDQFADEQALRRLI